MRSSGNKPDIDKNTEKKGGKGKLNFFLVFLVCWLVVITGIIAWFLLRFNDFAGKYESQYQDSLPYHTAELITQRFNEHDVGYILENMTQKPQISAFEDESVIEDYVRSLIVEKSFIYSETENSTESAPEYYIKTDDGLIVARVGLAEEKISNLPYGFKSWKEGSLEFYTDPVYEAKITAPETFRIYVNGIELTKKEYSEPVIESELNQYVEPYATVPGTASYLVKGLYKEPEVTAKDFRGNSCDCVYDENTGSYSVGFVKDFDEYDELSEFAISFASTFANFVSCDTKENALDKYFPSKSKTLSYIKNSRSVYTKHGNVSIHNEEIRDCIVYSEDVVYMEVFVEQWMEMYWGSDEPEVLPTDAHVYFVKIDGKWYVGGIKY
ncbi:MAG: hypothetical protein K5665_07300 [Saccharofermentans sp.]|nr:hypothetical protein [Saccharofermentans sp.]